MDGLFVNCTHKPALREILVVSNMTDTIVKTGPEGPSHVVMVIPYVFIILMLLRQAVYMHLQDLLKMRLSFVCKHYESTEH